MTHLKYFSKGEYVLQVFFLRYYGFIALEVEFLTWPFEEAFYRLAYQMQMRVTSFIVMNDIYKKHIKLWEQQSKLCNFCP